MKPSEATNHKLCLEEVKVSFLNKTLKIVVVENPAFKLASKCKLDFMGVSKLDVLQGIGRKPHMLTTISKNYEV